MIPDAVAQQWWSATATWRLLHCPASATPAHAPTRPHAQTPDNVGSVAHLALQTWVERGEWSHPECATRLQERFDEVATEHKIDPVRMHQGAATRARLKTRASQLAAILSSTSSDIRSEVLLRDESNRLFGILDIAGTGSDGFIIDFKTGRDASPDSSTAIEHQMTFYAHLFQASYGTLPKRVIVFSLRQGPTEIQVTPSMVAVLLDQIRAANLTELTVARPGAHTCRFCPKRMTCQPHWDAVPGWERPDAIEGVLENIERSSSRTTTALIGGRWLTGIPESALPSATVPGKSLRAVRVRCRNDSDPAEWTAGNTTHIQVIPR
ncbi:PD-(D/E)XK nuclease family protein [Pseudoclavibacter terrae]|uniref:PD-(D/E)XK nuclease family protein n=1 Tax=Pseudoclavibacter terrae TaxID=1530195 RepID=UPI00232C3248|nr:PD-(D/E)XK nuclease family protein [Pseudoclavibacter terrae]